MITKSMLGSKVLVTTDNWFYAPDGRQYRAVFGELKGILSDSDVLGIRTNARSTNWYAQIGTVLLAGCQIHYAVISDSCDTDHAHNDDFVDGEVKSYRLNSRIYNAE